MNWQQKIFSDVEVDFEKYGSDPAISRVKSSIGKSTSSATFVM